MTVHFIVPSMWNKENDGKLTPFSRSGPSMVGTATPLQRTRRVPGSSQEQSKGRRFQKSVYLSCSLGLLRYRCPGYAALPRSLHSVGMVHSTAVDGPGSRPEKEGDMGAANVC